MIPFHQPLRNTPRFYDCARGATMKPAAVCCSSAKLIFAGCGACLGIDPNPEVLEIVLRRPRLPDYIQWLRI
jgi:hypothetical protein